ncbi:hypothetical protein HD806DRAFT_531057 [Xylariaceae sp. AK1471]|nr:hypothetical protein HD806DRAFT_531057 [Xylariaceae sp. AK1471]
MAVNLPATTTSRHNTTRGALQDALNDFQSILTEDDIRELHKVKTLPDTDAVLIFTAQLDLRNRTRTGRSVASRLYSVLQSVRDFCSVVNSFVSSHPEIAALVWGSVKLTMLIATNFLSCYESLSELFLELGKVCPVFREYETLYQNSKRLQQSLFDFNASIIRFCKHVIEVVRRPYPKLLMLFVNEFQSDADAIHEHSRLVRDELTLAKAQADYQDQQLQDAERKAALEGRRKMTTFFSRTERDLDRISSWQLRRDERQARERRQQLLDNLSTHDYLIPLKQSRRERYGGTARWIFHTREYDRWINGTAPLLLCSGKIGSGKTILAASVIDHLLTEKRSPGSSVSFFFIRFDNLSSLKADTVFRSILRQRLNLNFPKELETRLAQLDSYSDPLEMADVIRTTFTYTSDTQYVVIDGLDECEKAARHDILRGLSLLVPLGTNVKVFLSGRESVSSEVGKSFVSLEYLSMHRAALDSDIKTYIENVIDEKIYSEDLVVKQSGLPEEIKRALMKGAHGMFLWVAFQVQEICSQHCDEDVKKAIENLPKDIRETFSRATRRIISRGQEKPAQQVFRWIAGAKRPLNLDEMGEALAIKVGQQYSRPERHYNDLRSVTLWCENLVRVDEELHIVQFAHRAVLQFLLEESPNSQFHFTLEEVDHDIGEICVTYLNFNDFKTTVAQRPQRHPRLQSLPHVQPISLAQTALTHGSGMSTISRILKVASSKLPSRSVSVEVIGDTTEPEDLVSKTATMQLESKYPFLHYASIYWIYHTAGFRQGRSSTWGLWKRMVFHGHALAKMPWGADLFDANDPTTSDWVFECPHHALLRHVIKSGPTYDKLCELVSKCDTETLGIILSDNEQSRELQQVLQIAAHRGDLGPVTRLLEAAATNDDYTTWCRLALSAAAEGGRLNVVEMILGAGADANVDVVSQWSGETALHIAAGHGHTEIVEALLGAGADVNARWFNDTPLHRAAGYGHTEIVEALLGAGADVNTRWFSDTPLHRAAGCGHAEIVETLLGAGADANATDIQGRTALTVAIGKFPGVGNELMEDIINRLRQAHIESRTEKSFIV